VQVAHRSSRFRCRSLIAIVSPRSSTSPPVSSGVSLLPTQLPNGAFSWAHPIPTIRNTELKGPNEAPYTPLQLLRQGAIAFAVSLLTNAASSAPGCLEDVSDLVQSTLEQLIENAGSHLPGMLPRTAPSCARDAGLRVKAGSVNPPRQVSSQRALGLFGSGVQLKPIVPKLCPKLCPKQQADLINESCRPQANPARRRLSQPIAKSDSDLRRNLTTSELRVAEFACQGLTVKAIAAKLFVSAKTVDFHLQSAYRKLGVHSRGEFVSVFVRLKNAS
jgi:DNA-binding CsgD family transcriptional regulator